MRIAPINTALVKAPQAAATVVPPTRTKVSASDLRAAIARACEQVHGSAPKELVDTLTAQASLETGSGQHMYNYNFGGIKGVGPTGLTAKCRTNEVLNGKTVSIVDGFRAYGTLDEGALDYVTTLRGRFGRSWDAAVVGDVRGFAHALKQQGYYTANEADYVKALSGLYRQGGGDPSLHSAQGPPPTEARAGPPGIPDALLVGRLDAALGQAMSRILAPLEPA